MIRQNFILPHRGTKGRKILLCLLRPRGLTPDEARQMQLVRDPRELRTVIYRIERLCGFDVRCIRDRKGWQHSRYQAVGRHRWNGSYHSLTQIPDDVPNLWP